MQNTLIAVVCALTIWAVSNRYTNPITPEKKEEEYESICCVVESNPPIRSENLGSVVYHLRVISGDEIKYFRLTGRRLPELGIKKGTEMYVRLPSSENKRFFDFPPAEITSIDGVSSSNLLDY